MRPRYDITYNNSGRPGAHNPSDLFKTMIIPKEARFTNTKLLLDPSLQMMDRVLNFFIYCFSYSNNSQPAKYTPKGVPAREHNPVHELQMLAKQTRNEDEDEGDDPPFNFQVGLHY